VDWWERDRLPDRSAKRSGWTGLSAITMNNKEERMLTCVPPWKHSGEMNDLTFDQYPGGRTS